MMFDKILVALNTEENYAPIFDRALALAIATKAELHLLGVVARDSEATLPLMAYPGVTGYPLTVSETIWTDYQENYKKLKERGVRTLSQLTEAAVAAGIEAAFSQQMGEAGKVICDRARALQCDLIIVGSHGRRGLDELLMGSVSSYVMHRAPCSVMVVHDQEQTEDTPTADERVISQPEAVTAL